MTEKKLTDEMRELAKSKSDALNLISGILGINIGGQPTVEISSREGFVWVRLRGNTSELIQAYNGSVSPIFGLPVLVTRSGNKYSIVGRDVEKYDNWGESSYLPKHGTQHSFAPELGFGGDVTWVYSRNIVPFLVMPSGSSGGAGVVIAPYVYNWNSDWKYAGDVGTSSLLGYKPTGTTNAKLVLVYLDGMSGTPTFLAGTEFSAALTGTSQIVPYIPDFSLDSGIPVAAVRLVTGTDVIGWDNIYDVRNFGFGITTGSSGGGSSIDTIGFAGQDEGVNLGTGTVLNVTGAGASLSRSGTVLNLSVPQGVVSTGAIQSYGNTQWLRLDTTNDPVHGALQITGTVQIDGTIGVDGNTAGNAGTFGGRVTVLHTLEVRSSGTPSVYISPNVAFTPSDRLLLISPFSSNGFWVDGIGDVYQIGNTFSSGTIQVSVNGDDHGAALSTSALTTPGNLATRGYYGEIYANEDGNFGGTLLYLSRYANVANIAANWQQPAVLIETYSESGTAVGELLKYDLNGTFRTNINPSQVGTGTAVLFDTEATLSHHGKLLMLENAGTPKFWVNASGTAFERNTPLAKESGAYGTFTTVDGKTVTVRAGIITNIV